MKMKAPATLLCALLIGLAAPAWADLSRDEAAAAAQHATNGRVLSVEKTQAGGQYDTDDRNTVAHDQITDGIRHQSLILPNPTEYVPRTTD